jgi:hypothetical protein
MLAVPTLVQVDAVANLSIVYISHNVWQIFCYMASQATVKQHTGI